MMHPWILDKYIHFELIYTTHEIFPVLPFKHLIDQYYETAKPYKLVTGTKPSVANPRVIFFHVL